MENMQPQNGLAPAVFPSQVYIAPVPEPRPRPGVPRDQLFKSRSPLYGFHRLQGLFAHCIVPGCVKRGDLLHPYYIAFIAFHAEIIEDESVFIDRPSFSWQKCRAPEQLHAHRLRHSHL